MKLRKKLFTMVGFFVIYCGFAQTMNKQWNVAIYNDEFTPEHINPTWNTHVFRTGADTLINDISYTQLLISYSEEFSDIDYFGAIRFDGKKVFINKEGYGDLLIYNFDLQKGDTLTVNRFEDIQTAHSIFVTVDSVIDTTFNKLSVKKLYVNYKVHDEYYENDIWLEGIGSLNHGLLNESCNGYTGCYETTYLLCYSENDDVLYHNPEFETCFYQKIVSVSDAGKKDLRIYPNPLVNGGIITIEATDAIKLVKVYDLGGKELINEKPCKKTTTLNLYSFKAGFYIVSVDGVIRKLVISK